MAATPNYLRQASQNLGKYAFMHACTENAVLGGKHRTLSHITYCPWGAYQSRRGQNRRGKPRRQKKQERQERSSSSSSLRAPGSPPRSRPRSRARASPRGTRVVLFTVVAVEVSSQGEVVEAVVGLAVGQSRYAQQERLQGGLVAPRLSYPLATRGAQMGAGSSGLCGRPPIKKAHNSPGSASGPGEFRGIWDIKLPVDDLL